MCKKGTHLRLLGPEQGEHIIHVRKVDTTESIAVRDGERWFLTEGEGIAKLEREKSRINYWCWIKIEGMYELVFSNI